MSTGFGGAFEAIFGLRDGASDSLNRIRSNAVGLSTDVANLSQQVVNFISNLRYIRADVPIGSPRTRAQLIDIEQRLERLGQTGNITAGSLQRVTNELRLLATRSTGPQLQAALNQTADEMAGLTAQLRLAETDARKTGNSFAFMGDVSQGTAQRFRVMSSASQGLLLGLAALDGNIQNLAFSLIFLQFAGFSRLALAAAGASAVIGGAIQLTQRFLANRRETQQLSAEFQILTGNIDALRLAQAQAAEIARRLQLENTDEEFIIESLTKAFLGLRQENIQVSDVIATVLVSALLQARAAGRDMDTAIQDAIGAAVSFATETETSFRGFPRTFEEMKRQGTEALRVLSGTSVVTKADIIAAFEEIHGFVPPSVREALEETEGEFVNFHAVVPLIYGRVIQRLKKLTEDPTTGLPGIQKIFESALEGFVEATDRNATAIEGRFTRMLNKLIADIEAAQRAINSITEAGPGGTPQGIDPEYDFIQSGGGLPTVPSTGGMIDPEYDFIQSGGLPTLPLPPGDPEYDFPSGVSNSLSININNPNVRNDDDIILIEHAIIDAIRRGTGSGLGFIDVT